MNKTPLKSKNGIQFGRCIYIDKPIEKQLSGSLRVNCGGSPEWHYWTDKIFLRYGRTGRAFYDPSFKGRWDFRVDGLSVAFMVKRQDLFFW